MEEKIYWEGKRSRKSFIGLYTLSGFIFLVAILTGLGVLSNIAPVIEIFSSYIAIAIACIGVLLLTVIEVKRILIKYVVTNRRVIKETGLVNKKKDYIPYQMVEKMSLNQMWYQRILKIGNIKVDTGEAHFYLDSIDNPNKVEDSIRSAMSRMHRYEPHTNQQNQNNYNQNRRQNSYPQGQNQNRRRR